MKKYICGKCGTKVKKYYKECPKCGKKFNKQRKDTQKIKKKLIWIGGILIGIMLILISFNFYLENREKEYFDESCWYVMDKYPDICVEIVAKLKADIRLTIEEIRACPCKDRSGINLNMGPAGKFFEGDEEYVGEGCIYHKECEKQKVKGIHYYGTEYDPRDIQNVNVNLDGSTVLRRGTITVLIVKIENTNKGTDLTIKNIKLLDSSNNIIDKDVINQKIKPIRKEINKLNNIITLPLPFMKGPMYMWWAQKIIPKIQEGSFRKSYRPDIRDFSLLSPKIGERVNIFVEVEFSYKERTFIVKRSHSILISEPLPIPPRD